MDYSAIVNSILEQDAFATESLVSEALLTLAQSKMAFLAENISSTLVDDEFDIIEESLDESEIDEDLLSEKGRFRIVRVRIRNGKIQRRKKVSNVKGWTFRKGHLIKMSPTERRHRRMGARRAKIKRRSERVRIRLHQKRALRKRAALGLSR